ncbi:GAF domain-containing protein [Pontibacter ummariensis]|uniref:GAF domain-containing protein n=2 Tax=Pontibacter ummariensis TaxID=1610492 RepID=A0A239I6D6_9BACT|nr:GAF domain-containing protein [Pontibacter ummariensis]SNS87914.1 GAF domain-containing protein [Pontibacter ummariensis]
MVNVTIDQNYDSEFCGSIPLHLVNLIQPHGMLLVLDKPELRIRQASANVESFLSISVDDLLGQPLSSYLPASQYEDLQAKMAQQDSPDKIPLSLVIKVAEKDVAFTALLHPREEHVLLELEENTTPGTQESFISLYQHIKYITTLLKQTANTQEIAQLVAAEIKKFTGFDRVLVYQFDPQWNGIVIAQAKEKDMDDYMDLRFPASDVPKQARDLYFTNPYRLIPTRDYTPVRLIPVVNPLTQRFTDLGDSNLRSVAPVHLEYLANMNIVASMSLPLIINDNLWGLISCHHKTAKNPSYELRSALELLSGIVSAQIAAKEREQAILLQARLRGLHGRLLEQLYTSPGLAEGLLDGATNLQELLNLTGAAVLFEGSSQTSGNTPGKQEMKELVSWLRRNHKDKVYVTDQLPKHYPQSKGYKDVASGLIALPLNAEQGEYILGFRPEVLQTVNWGGNPNQAIQLEPDGKSYHPRNSFATYQETVKHTSLAWSEEEVEAGETLRNAVLEKILKERY